MTCIIVIEPAIFDLYKGIENLTFCTMRSILVMNDGTIQAVHAAKFAFNIAYMMHTALLLANTVPLKKTSQQVLAGTNIEQPTYQLDDVIHLAINTSKLEDFQAPVSEIDISELNEAALIQTIREQDILMVVKCMPDTSADKNKLNMNAVLNRITCPLLLVPENWEIKKIERLVYIADLRFCRNMIVSYLAALARPSEATLSIAHLSAKGIPDMEENYARAVFKDQVADHLNYKNLHFNNIKEKDLKKALDVIINGLHNDILALVNHRFHFEEILGRYITDVLPENITVPLLIFPY